MTPAPKAGAVKGVGVGAYCVPAAVAGVGLAL